MRTTLKLSEIVDEWLSDCDVQPGSKDDYRKKINLWFRFLSSRKVEPRSPLRKHVIEWKDTMQRDNRSLYTINAYVTTVKLFYSWCKGRGYYDDIAAGIKSSKTQKYYNKQPLSFDQAARLINSISTDNLKGKRDRLIISLMIFNGLRICEIMRINISDITTLEEVPVLYIQRKGRVDKQDLVVLHPGCVEMFEDYISGREFGLDDPLFISHRLSDSTKVNRLVKHSIARMVKLRLKAVGIVDKKISAHSLRHTFGTLMVENNVPLDEVKDMMGHSSVNVTRIYTEMVRRKKMLHQSPVIEFGDKLLKRK